MVGCSQWRANGTAFAGNFDGILAWNRAHLFHADGVAESAVAKDAVIDGPTGAMSVNTAFELAGFRGIFRGRGTSGTTLSFAKKGTIAFQRRTRVPEADAAAMTGAGQTRFAAPRFSMMIHFAAL